VERYNQQPTGGTAMREQIKQAMREVVTEAIKQTGETLEKIRDNQGEWIDGYLPIYNGEIVREWQEMPSEYDNRGSAELGAKLPIDIVQLMNLDLYLYYSDIFNEAITELEQEAGE
jgi:hypothetical protein